MKLAWLTLILTILLGSNSAFGNCFFTQESLTYDLSTECKNFVVQYEEFISKVADRSLSFDLKQDIIEEAIAQFFLTDSVYIYDDLYLNTDDDQYFPCKLYLLTLISWYPNGVEIEFLNVHTEKFYIHQQGKYIQAKVYLDRTLVGTDFVDAVQRDTTGLEFHLQFGLDFRGEEWILANPRILAISPLKSQSQIPTSITQTSQSEKGDSLLNEANTDGPGAQRTYPGPIDQGDTITSYTINDTSKVPASESDRQKALKELAKLRSKDQRRKKDQFRSWDDWIK